MFQQIIVPLDGSEEAAEALGPASAMARRIGAPMHVVALHLPGRDTSQLELTVLSQCDATGDVVRVIELRPIEVDVATDLTRLAHKWGPALIVMASHGRGRSAALLGSVTSEILSVVDQPVLLVGPNVIRSRFSTHGTAVVAVDGRNDDEVLSLMATLLADTDFDPFIVNVIDPKEARELDLARSGPGGFDLPAETAVAHLAAARLEASTDVKVVDYEVEHSRKPADALVHQAIEKRASMIVMTTHARQGFDRLACGSVAADVVRDAPCPVMITGLDVDAR